MTGYAGTAWSPWCPHNDDPRPRLEPRWARRGRPDRSV